MKKQEQKGFIGTIITLVVALALLKYFFDFSIIDFIKSPKVIEVLEYIKKAISIIWNKFLVGPVVWIWDTIIVNLVWEALKNGYDILTGWVDSQ